MEESLAENEKKQRAEKLVCCVNTDMVKDASFTWNDLRNWNITSALFINVRFLFELLVSKKSEQYVAKAVRINSPNCSLVRVARGSGGIRPVCKNVFLEFY